MPTLLDFMLFSPFSAGFCFLTELSVSNDLSHKNTLATERMFVYAFMVPTSTCRISVVESPPRRSAPPLACFTDSCTHYIKRAEDIIPGFHLITPHSSPTTIHLLHSIRTYPLSLIAALYSLRRYRAAFLLS